ncbi:MAG: hypothetical protein AABZ08_12320 [Planctomycetota bacterium]
MNMFASHLIMIIVVVTCAQTSQPTGTPTTQPRRGDQRDNRRRERLIEPRPESMNDRDRQRYERMLESAARLYNLDELQRAMVRNQIDAMSAERRAAMGADAIEYDRLREEVRKMQSLPGGVESTPESRRTHLRDLRNDPQFRDVRAKLNEFENKYPIDMESAIERVEKLIPPEQAEAGRKRRDERMSAFRQRREQRQQRTAATSQPTTAPSSLEPLEQPAPPPAPLHPWELLVRRFISDHGLTDAQSNAALAMLREVRSRASQIEKTQTDRVTDANALRDAEARKKSLADLNKPYDELFDELKNRLDSLLTAAQRAQSPITHP